jgi:hypothetical protein
MRVGLSTAPRVVPAGERQVAPTRTAVTREELRGAIHRALEKADGARPSPALVDVLTAHASLETASGASMYNFNFGGIKGHAPDGGIAKLRTHEVLGGKEVEIRDGFRAYASLDDGAVDYVRTMKTRFGGALAPASKGDVVGFAGALKRAGYYTAAESDYARGLASQMRAPAFGASAATGASARLAVRPLGGLAVPPLDEAVARTDLGLTSAGLSRVSDALDAERFLGTMSSPRPHRAEAEEDES